VFTGIVERVGVIAGVRSVPGGRRLRVNTGPMAAECALGSSIAVSGVCLTVTDRAPDALDFDVVTETLERSTLGAKHVGDQVNLERSLRVGDRLDGHFVQGHVDGTAVVDQVLASSREYRIRFKPDPPLMPHIIPRGSVAIDGVSLTVAATEADAFSIAMIPTTLDRTTLATLAAGHAVNIETDMLVRAVAHRLSALSGSPGLTLDALRRAGFA
jgi:riboflavin synthase